MFKNTISFHFFLIIEYFLDKRVKKNELQNNHRFK